MATGRVPTTANSPLTAKGDLFGYSTAPARLAVGNDGEQIVADSSTSTGLRYQGNFSAGKNLIINGDFGIWQRGTTFANPSFSDYLCDRFRMVNYNTAPTSATISQQTFTPGSAPVAGYEGQYFFRSTITTVGSTTQYDYGQYIEDFREVAGRTITVSFWAKSDSSRSQSMYAGYNNITGIAGVSGSPFSFTTTTSWQRFTFTFTPSSLAGATISANANFYIFVRQACASGSVFDWWGVQVEVGNTATAFQTATGTIQGELAACQRYFYSGALSNSLLGSANSSSSAYWSLSLPVTMRIAPTATYPSTLTSIVNDVVNAQNRTPTAIATYVNNVGNVAFYATGMPAVLTVGGPVLLQTSISWSSEL
jgi:hypothetical protein